MSDTGPQNTDEFMSMLRSAVAQLDEDTVRILVAHPDAVTGAIAAAGAILLHVGHAAAEPE